MGRDDKVKIWSQVLSQVEAAVGGLQSCRETLREMGALPGLSGTEGLESGSHPACSCPLQLPLLA